MNFPYIIPTSQYPSVFLGQYFIPDGGKPIDFYVQHPIEWLVLEMDKKNKKALLLSKYILDWEGFADCPLIGNGYETSWDDSYLRGWLNGEFCQKCFSSDELKMITPIYNSASCENGKRSIDKVFLLSAEEVKKYFPSDEAAVAFMPDLKAAMRTGHKDSPIIFDFDKLTWWTRTAGSTNDLVVCVNQGGSLCEKDSNCSEIGVRPAIWVTWNTSDYISNVDATQHHTFPTPKNDIGPKKSDEVVFADDQGNETIFHIFDMLIFRNEEYAFLLVEGGNWEEDGLLVVKIVRENKDINYIPVWDEAMMDDLFDALFKRHPN